MDKVVVIGASGHIGSTVIDVLLQRDIAVVAVCRSPEKAEWFDRKNVEARVLDVMDTTGLRGLFLDAKRAFLLNPPADPAGDTDMTEKETARSIAHAVKGSGLEKVVLASTYGAQPGNRIGDLSVLYEFEQLIQATGVPAAINRGAYYFTNLDPLIDSARQGVISSPFPDCFQMPMISPDDLGTAAADRLLSPISDVGIRYVEGPSRYTFADVAQILSQALKRPVRLETIPRDQIENSFRQMGFSAVAADAYARMTIASIDGPELPDHPKRGKIALSDYIESLLDCG